MKAFHGKLAIKKKYLNRVEAHRLADEIVKGRYWEEGKGCAVGCTIHSSNHNAYESELGIPEWLARLEDTLFEGLPNERAKTWPHEFLKATRLGTTEKQFAAVKTKFIVYVLEQSIKQMRSAKFDHNSNSEVVAAQDQVESAIKEMIRCHKNGLDTRAADSTAYSAAESAARAAESTAYAARSAADSTAYSAAESAARAAESAAESTAYAARSAADSTAYSAAESAARAARAAESTAYAARSAADSTAYAAYVARSAAYRAAYSAAYERYADKLIKLLRGAK